MALIFAPGFFSPFQPPPFVSGLFFPTLFFIWIAVMPCFRFALRIAWSVRVFGLALSACDRSASDHKDHSERQPSHSDAFLFTPAPLSLACASAPTNGLTFFRDTLCPSIRGDRHISSPAPLGIQS
jgi:hypothetical protein